MLHICTQTPEGKQKFHKHFNLYAHKHTDTKRYLLSTKHQFHEKKNVNFDYMLSSYK